MIRQSRKGKIYNPETGRWVKKNGRVGRRVSTMRFGNESSKRRLIKKHGKEYYLNKNGKIDGIFKQFSRSFSSKGVLILQGKYVNGQKQGIWERWYGNGQLKEKGSYVNGEEQGIWKRWYDNGQLEEKGNYVNGQKQEIWEQWYGNGQLRKKGSYVNGEEQGIWKEWHDNGQLRKKGSYVNGGKQGIWKWWYNDGQLFEKGSYENGEKQGIWERWWDDNGQLEEKGNYVNDEKQGIWEQWYDNGQLEEKKYYDEQGIRQLITWLYNGEILSFCKIKRLNDDDDFIQIYRVEFNPDGSLHNPDEYLIPSNFKDIIDMILDVGLNNALKAMSFEKGAISSFKNKLKIRIDDITNRFSDSMRNRYILEERGIKNTADLEGFMDNMAFGNGNNLNVSKYRSICREDMKNKYVSELNRKFTWKNYKTNLPIDSVDYRYYNYCDPKNSNYYEGEEEELYFYEMILAKMNEMGY